VIGADSGCLEETTDPSDDDRPARGRRLPELQQRRLRFDGRRTGPKLHPQELGVARTDVGRRAEFHVLARFRQLLRPRLKAGRRDALGVRRSFAKEVALAGSWDLRPRHRAPLARAHPGSTG